MTMAREKTRRIKAKILKAPAAGGRGGTQVIIKLVNKHGVSIAGTVYAQVGITETMDKLVAVLTDSTKVFDFRHPTGTITRVWTNELVCAHTNQHVFSFDIAKPEDGHTYEVDFT